MGGGGDQLPLPLRVRNGDDACSPTQWFSRALTIACCLPAGEVCIEGAGWPYQQPPRAPDAVRHLECSGLECHTAPEADGSATTVLSARLAWLPPPQGVRCCHVWCRFHGGSDNGGGEAAWAGTWCWLGAACADGYWVTGLVAPVGSTAVSFAVQPVGCNGLAAPLLHGEVTTAAAAAAAAAAAGVPASSRVTVDLADCWLHV